MAYLYYPGCTLKTKAKALDQYAIKSMEALGVDFIEKDDWQCCGAVYPMARDEIATRLSAVRTLEDAGREGRKLLTLCSACHQVMKRINYDMQTDDNIRLKVNNYSQFDMPYTGGTEVVHFLEMLRDHVGFDEIKKRVTAPLSGRKIGAYYGCLLLRPGGVMQFDDPENPSIMEDFIRAIGAEPVIYSYRNECCGSYAALESKGQVRNCCQKVLASATDKGADALITACPLCLYNLDTYSGNLPVYYFTQLLAEALGVQHE
ncbi:MAG: CoB--CoM heterodisulfide reductase iron-sulfur subunit B family protein [Defluviitaleaceae bacterium]|nr:CoB--CoM heterodisulfide reductase iron-sulfur subunit B family protein [Defluviitaleaceae bacterium]